MNFPLNCIAPGNKLKKQLSRGDHGVNPLDKAHGTAYSLTEDTNQKNKPDLQLADSVWEGVKATDTKLGEGVNVWFVTNIIKAKAKIGMGIKSSITTLRTNKNSHLLTKKNL